MTHIRNAAAAVARQDEGRNEAPPHDPIESLGPVGELVTVYLNRLDHLLRRATAEAWGNRNLRSGTIGALSLISANPGISQNEIVRQTVFDKSAVNAIVNGLEALGWAYRDACGEDRRRNALFVTPDGQEALDRVVARIKTVERRALAGITPAQRARFIAIAQRMYENLYDLNI